MPMLFSISGSVTRINSADIFFTGSTGLGNSRETDAVAWKGGERIQNGAGRRQGLCALPPYPGCARLWRANTYPSTYSSAPTFLTVRLEAKLRHCPPPSSVDAPHPPEVAMMLVSGECLGRIRSPCVRISLANATGIEHLPPPCLPARLPSGT